MNKEPVWDFQLAFGEAIRNKHKSKYIRVVEMTHLSLRKPIHGTDGTPEANRTSERNDST